MKALVLAAGLLLSPVAPSVVTSFPPPRMTGVTPDLKCDWGDVISARADLVTVKTDAGPFEAKVSAGSKLASVEGRPIRSAAELHVGQKARVYYRVDNRAGGGANAQEIDLY